MDLNASVICCEIRLRLWLVQKRYEAEQAAKGQESDASDGGNHGCVEEHWHITALAGPWQGHYKAGRGQEKSAHTSAFPALLMML
jgi:hypothetical protein